MRAAEDLAAEAARVHHGADVGHREVVDDAVDAGLDVHFDFGEAGDERVGLAVARQVVARHAHQAQAGERRRRGLGHRVDVLRQLVAVELAAALDGALRRLARR